MDASERARLRAEYEAGDYAYSSDALALLDALDAAERERDELRAAVNRYLAAVEREEGQAMALRDLAKIAAEVRG